MNQATCFIGRSTGCFKRFFEHSHFDVSVTLKKKRGSNQEKSSKSGSHIEISSPRTHKRADSDRKGGQQEEPIPSFEKRKDPRASGPPCNHLLEKETIHMVSVLRMEACSRSIDDLVHIPTQNCLALTKASVKADNLIAAVRTRKLLDVDIHPHFKNTYETQGLLVNLL